MRREEGEVGNTRFSSKIPTHLYTVCATRLHCFGFVNKPRLTNRRESGLLRQ